MHILFLTDNFPPEVNAPASRTYEHAVRWVSKGCKVTVITCFPNFEGFVIQQNASITNEYVFGFGNGKRWAKARKFTLSHGKKHNVKIELGKRTVKIYVNNNLVHKSQRKVNYMNTELPVTIGGYIYGGRELNGTVYKFTIKNL